MKKHVLAVSLAMALILSACGTSPASNDTEETESEVVSVADISETESQVSEDESTEETPDEAEESVEESSEEDSDESEIVLEYNEFFLADGLSETYADLDNRSFVYDGKLYKLGEATLQDLIDGGLPFRESELKNADNNVNPNYETSTYTLKINDLTSMQVNFMNQTSDSLTEKECLLSYVRWYTIYVPHDDYDDSLVEEIYDSINDASEHLSFAFPLYLTKDELLENSPEPTDSYEYGQVTYKVDSEVYMGSSGYTFNFDEETNQLEEVGISWLP